MAGATSAVTRLSFLWSRSANPAGVEGDASCEELRDPTGPPRAKGRARPCLGGGAGGGVGWAGADPARKDRIDSAKSNEGQLSNRVEALSQRIASLEEQARRAGARAMELNAQVQRAEARSRELARQLAAAQTRLEELRG